MTNEKQLENQEKVRMPWQGKAWISVFIFMILNIIFAFFSVELFRIYFDNFYADFILSVFLILNSIVFSLFEYFESVGNSFWMRLIAIIILNLYFLFGFLKGKILVIYISIISSILSFVLLIDILKNPFESFSIGFAGINVFLLLIKLYFEIACLKHPYYNQKKKMKE